MYSAHPGGGKVPIFQRLEMNRYGSSVDEQLNVLAS
jgi:hypothetical protein